MIEENHPTNRYGETVAVDQSEPLVQGPRTFTWVLAGCLFAAASIMMSKDAIDYEVKRSLSLGS